MQNKKSIIVGIACGVGVFVLLVVLSSYAGGQNLKGDLFDQIFGIFSKQEVSVETPIPVIEPVKTYTKDEIMAMAKSNKNNYLPGLIKDFIGSDFPESPYSLTITANPSSGSYDTAQDVTLSAIFVDSNGKVAPYTSPISLYYDNLDDAINGFLPYSQSFIVSENRNNTNPNQNRISIIGVYTGGVGLGYANYTITDPTPPEIASAAYYEDFGYIEVKFSEIMNYSTNFSPEKLQSMFSFNNGTTVSLNSYGSWWDNWNKNTLYFQVENFEDETVMTYNADSLNDASGNVLTAGIETSVKKLNAYFPRVTAVPESGSYDMPMSVNYNVTFVDINGNVVPATVYTEPVTIYSRVIPYYDFSSYFPYTSPAQRVVYGNSVLMYYGVTENTYRWTEVESRTYTYKTEQPMSEKPELFHGQNALMAKQKVNSTEIKVESTTEDKANSDKKPEEVKIVEEKTENTIETPAQEETATLKSEVRDTKMNKDDKKAPVAKE